MDLCSICQLIKDLCYCHLIPELDTCTRISFILHNSELGRASNTGYLAHRSLINSDMRVFGDGKDWRQWQQMNLAGYETLILSSRSSHVVSPQFMQAIEKPIHLVVPDGNWRQGHSMTRKLAFQFGLRTVSLPQMPSSYYPLRRRHNEQNGVSTIEAVAKALDLFGEGDASARLNEIFKTMLDRWLCLGHSESSKR
ncbi:MAG: hypothetical protein CMP10_20845 [Zetaproteobacteria bacterium]|nr:hypothetical protein [Pseudobdellovibrionaceae bacterium]